VKLRRRTGIGWETADGVFQVDVTYDATFRKDRFHVYRIANPDRAYWERRDRERVATFDTLKETREFLALVTFGS
jgi:hypothetical protein